MAKPQKEALRLVDLLDEPAHQRARVPPHHQIEPRQQRDPLPHLAPKARPCLRCRSEPSQAKRSSRHSRNATALARVKHPAVVSVFAVEQQPHPDTAHSCLAIVMDCVSGTSLSLHRGSLSLDLAGVILSTLSSGLEAIHDVGLVHGDLHDANVMIHERGATILDILYTHSLQDVGTRTAQKTRGEDLRDLAERQYARRTQAFCA